MDVTIEMVVVTGYTLVIVAVNIVDMHDTINMTDFIADMTNTFQEKNASHCCHDQHDPDWHERN